MDQLSAGTERQRVGGIKVEVLRPAARALHVALHAAQHGSRASKPTEDLRRALALLDDDLWHEAAVLAAHIQALPASRPACATCPRARFWPRDWRCPTRFRLRSRCARVFGRRSPSGSTLWRARTVRRRSCGCSAGSPIPSPSLMRARQPLARRGVIGLLLAYLWRLPYLVLWAGPALWAWIRARRQSHPHRPPAQ